MSIALHTADRRPRLPRDDRLDATIQYGVNGAVSLSIESGPVVVMLNRDQVRVLRLVREVFGEDDFLVAASLGAAALARPSKAAEFERCLQLFEERAREEDARFESAGPRHRSETKPLMRW